ncbi:MAG: GntR family transcriptional regulator [Chloroflexi bacterium]|nr:GntR family transcriptional regulator [Chloroflexota bacterium]
MAGTYLPNQRLIEAEVTLALGVSRTTLRAALIRLQEEGLVEIEINRGAHVRAFTLDEAVQILLVREVLEGLAAVLASQKASEAELAALRAVVEEMKDALAIDDVMKYAALNHRFHRIILNAAGHEIVSRFLGSLQYPLIRYQFGSILVPGRRDSSLGEHQAILAALEAHDAPEAERLARLHVANVRSAVLKNGGPLA